jgi:hypothetical protein
MTLADRSDHELVAELNETLATPGWVRAKGDWLVALRTELIHRGFSPPMEERNGVVVFGYGRRYAIIDGELSDVTNGTRP